MKIISRTIIVLSFVSFFTDVASEMLYPVMPLYLKHIGFSIVFIGILEGIAEGLSGLSKAYFGKWSDVIGKRMPFVRIGYLLSAISRPMMVALSHPIWVFFARSTDRLGKGIRTSARDALLSDESTKENKAKVFGFHRSMDTFGAVLGPSLALLFLYFYPEHYKELFLLAFIPGVLAVLLTYFIKEKTNIHPEPGKVSVWEFFKYWKSSNQQYKSPVIGFLLFAIINSSDVFLLLRAKELGISDQMVIGLYIFYNFIYAVAAYPLGALADKIGLKYVYAFGLSLFATVYFCLGYTNETSIIILLFAIYGIFSAATEGISKAWISKAVHKHETATAIGTYSSFQSVFTLISSTIAGIIWYKWSGETLMIYTGITTALIAIYFLFVKEKGIDQDHTILAKH